MVRLLARKAGTSSRSVSGFDAIWRIAAICAVGLVSAHLIGLEATAVSPVLLWLLMVLLLQARRVLLSCGCFPRGRLYNYAVDGVVDC